MTTKYRNIDDYIANFPLEIREKLEKIRGTIQENAPDATECINYGIPTFKLHGNLVHFAAYKKHIGFYPGASGVAAFEEELRHLKTSKGAIQFPTNADIPYNLIARIVVFRVKENLAKKGK